MITILLKAIYRFNAISIKISVMFFAKWIIDLNIRAKMIKLLEEHIGENLHDIGFGTDFLVMTPKAQITKGKIGKMNFTKIKNFNFKRMKRVKRQPTEWENIFKSYI